MARQDELRDDYTYENAGLDEFFSRSIVSGVEALATSGVGVGSQQLNFDQLLVGGSLGDRIQIGNILLDGVGQKITLSNGEVVQVLIGRGDF